MIIFKFLFGSALPQILTSEFRCQTILLPNNEAIFIWAFVEKTVKIILRISIIGLIFFKVL